MPEEKQNEWVQAIKDTRAFADKAMENRDLFDAIVSAPPVAGAAGAEGYSDGERTDMDRLIESNQ